MVNRVDIPGFVELFRQNCQRIVLDVADQHLGGDSAEVEAVLLLRLDDTGASTTDIAKWARLISNGQRPLPGADLDWGDPDRRAA